MQGKTKNRRRKRRQGFMARSENVIKSRRRKGRKRIGI